MRSPPGVVFLCLGLMFNVPVLAGAPTTLYVATNGNDGWSGKSPGLRQKGTDGPFLTVEAALKAARAIRQQQPEQPIRIRIRGGRHELRKPVELLPEDSGTASAPMVVEANPGEKPVLSGGMLLRNFRQKGELWETVIPEVKRGGVYFRQLFVNGSRRQLARSPNSDYFRVSKFLPGPPVKDAKPYLTDRFIARVGDLTNYANLRDAYVILMHSWETSIHPLQSIDEVSNLVQFVAPLKEWWGMGYWEEAQRYYVENARELLDEPGEWYLDRQTGVLTYWPLPGETIDRAEVVAPVLTELLRFRGNADRGKLVRHVIVRGLSFQHADWILDPKGNSSTQAAVEVPAVITADGAANCVIEHCDVKHVGTYGIWFQHGCKDCLCRQNRLSDLGAGGIRVGETQPAKTDSGETTHTVVDNNHIFDGGHVSPAGIGIWVAQSSSNIISHNDIHDLLYSGLSIGWNWNDAPNRTHHNIIEYNHVHDLGHGVLSDAGLIYCLGVSPGSVIRNNVFHDMWPYNNPAFGWGVYLDATCGNYLVESNLVYNTLSGGLMFNNGGHEHVIRNNIFALSVNHQLWPYFEKRANTFRRNIVYLSSGELFIPYAESSLKARLAKKESVGGWDQNVYWDSRGEGHLKFLGRSFSEWQSLGLDAHSRVIDPQFENPAKGNFRLQKTSPAKELGFRAFELSQVGLYGSGAWKNEGQHANCHSKPLPVASKR